MRVGLLERLQIGVDRDELDALDLRLDHAVDRVDACAPDPDDAQHRASRGERFAPRRRLVVGPRVRVGPAHHARLGRGLEDVLGELRAEGVAQALLRRGDVPGRLGRLLGGLAERRVRVVAPRGGVPPLPARADLARGGLRLRAGGLRRSGLRSLGGSGLRRLGGSGLRSLGKPGLRSLGKPGLRSLGRRGPCRLGRLGRLGRLFSLVRGLLGLAEERRERPLPHARALTACHLREPPSRGRDRTGRPCRPDRI